MTVSQEEHEAIVQERDMLRREIEAIEDALWDEGCALWYADDIEHFIGCHADTLPDTARLLAKALMGISRAGRERHEKEDPG
jgi:hypothetical protein